MKVLTCAAARRRLQAFHDGELPVGDQIGVAAHLEWCDDCVERLAEMQVLRAALRSTAPGRRALAGDEDAGLHASIVSRVRAETSASPSARLRGLFDDMHMIYAGLGASAATVACVTIVLSMMGIAAGDRLPGSNQNPVVVDARMLMPRALDSVLMAAPGRDGDEAAFTLSGVVTREGRIVNLEWYPESGHAPVAGSREAAAAESLLGAVSRAQFEPAKVAGLPVAVNMVWMVTHTTVRANVPFRLPARTPVKKRQATYTGTRPTHGASLV